MAIVTRRMVLEEFQNVSLRIYNLKNVECLIIIPIICYMYTWIIVSVELRKGERRVEP